MLGILIPLSPFILIGALIVLCIVAAIAMILGIIIAAIRTAVTTADVAVKGTTAVVMAKKSLDYFDAEQKVMNRYTSEMFDDDEEKELKRTTVLNGLKRSKDN